MFDIPVVLFLFRRSNTLKQIMGRIAEIKPSRLYLLADAGRNEKEHLEAQKCREIVENLITWDCEIIKNYAIENRGVYKNIGEGAKWVFEQEEVAIFLEDDNLPEVSFFNYSKQLLDKYKDDPKVLWICGTNYYEQMQSDYSYCFTKHLLPCGWASWSDKFLKCYDGELKSFKNIFSKIKFFKNYKPGLLGFVQYQSIANELFRYKKTGRFLSWDYQMLWSVRSNDLYGIVPMYNQITNIGVDNYSIHGGSSKTNIMTDRFCEIRSKSLQFPLIHPPEVKIDEKCELLLGNIICPPYKNAIKSILGSKFKHLLGQDTTVSLKDIFSGGKSNK